MKKTVHWNGLIAMMAILAMSVCVFGCTDQTSTTVDGGNVSASGSITGLVVDVNNDPIEGAEAWLRYPGGNQRVTTSPSGKYLFTGVPHSSSPYLITVVVPIDQDTCEFEIVPDTCNLVQTLCDTEFSVCVANPLLICSVDEDCPVEGTCDDQPLLSCDSDEDCATTVGTCAAQPSVSCTDDEDCAVAEYAVTYTAAELAPVGENAVVTNTMAEAVPAVMRRQNATVIGRTASNSGQPIGSALVTLNPSTSQGPPNAEYILAHNESSWAIGDATTLSVAGTGLFTFTGVPEGSDARPVEYVVTITAPGLQLCEIEDGPLGDGHPIVVVGTGGHTYWVEGGDTIALCPPIPTEDEVNPYVVQTNLPSETISGSALDKTWCWLFNEPVDQDIGDAFLRYGSIDGAPVDLDPAMSGWNLSGIADCPSGTDDFPVLSVTPAEPLVIGPAYVFELRNIVDAAGNAYDGTGPLGGPDAFTSLGQDTEVDTARLFTTGGDLNEMCVTGLAQADALSPPPPDPPIGGKSAVFPQANNENDLGAGNTDTFTLDWDDAEACDGSGLGQATAYRVYARVSGIPLLVGTVDSDPLESEWTGTLTDVNNAILAWNGVEDNPQLPTLTNVDYFDDALIVDMAVTAVNGDIEGPYSNVAPVMDNVPPTAVDQGEGFDEAGIGGADPTYLPFLTVDWDLTALPDPYVAADLDATGDVDIAMSEDMAFPQTATGTLTAADFRLTLLSVNIVAEDTRSVTAVLDNINVLADNDTLALSVTDEAGNPSEADATVILLDGVVPMVAGAADTDPNMELEVTFTEPVLEASVVPGAFDVNGVTPDTAELSPTDATVVTLTSADFNAPEGLYVITATGVQDLATAANASPGIGFQFQGEVPDLTPPAITTAYHVQANAPDINSVDPAVSADGIWSVGDAATDETWTITFEYSEPLDPGPGIGLVFTAGPLGDAVCTFGSLNLPGDQTGTFTLTCTSGTVAEGDTITITNAQDLAGNALDPNEIILQAVGAGTNIDPIVIVP